MVLRRDGYYVLADLGLVASLEPPHPPPRGRTGSRGYWAPEVVRKEPQDEAADWWSLGVTLAYAASGTHPFRRPPPRAAPPPPPAPAATHLDGASAQPLPPTATTHTDHVGAAAAGDEPASALVPKWNEEELNENTLNAPIELPSNIDDSTDPHASQLLRSQCELNRLGSVGSNARCASRV